MAFLWSGQLSQVRQSFQQWGGEWDGKSLFPLSGTVWHPPFTSLEKVVVVTAVCGLSVVRSTCPGIALDWGWRGRHWCVSRSGSKERSWSREGGRRDFLFGLRQGLVFKPWVRRSNRIRVKFHRDKWRKRVFPSLHRDGRSVGVLLRRSLRRESDTWCVGAHAASGSDLSYDSKGLEVQSRSFLWCSTASLTLVFCQSFPLR